VTGLWRRLVAAVRRFVDDEHAVYREHGGGDW
jgi:hypothetical protein